MGLEELKEDANDREEEPIEVDSEVVGDDDDTGKPVNVAGEGPSLIQPVEDLDAVAGLYETFEEIKQKILKSEDIQKISGNTFVTKSGWRKIATAFNLSVEVVEKERALEDGVIKYYVKARAAAPNGKVSTDVAMCASNESNHMETLGYDDDVDDDTKERDDVISVDGKWRRLKNPNEVNEHNIYATAATRAKNRAISDCVGGGEVSAEEVTKEMAL